MGFEGLKRLFKKRQNRRLSNSVGVSETADISENKHVDGGCEWVSYYIS